jgi:hypothetical protein
MRVSKGELRPNNLRLFWIAAVLAACGIVILFAEPFETAGGKTAVVTYTRGVLHVTIPFHAVHSGDGKLTVEVLDPEDKVLGHAETQIAIDKGYGRWQEGIRLDKALGIDDLVWHRVRYRYEYDGGKAAVLEGTAGLLNGRGVRDIAFESGFPSRTHDLLAGYGSEFAPLAGEVLLSMTSRVVGYR